MLLIVQRFGFAHSQLPSKLNISSGNKQQQQQTTSPFWQLKSNYFPQY
jgi:hypothetical protein